jgi:hypothetical protein
MKWIKGIAKALCLVAMAAFHPQSRHQRKVRPGATDLLAQGNPSSILDGNLEAAGKSRAVDAIAIDPLSLNRSRC